MLKMLLKKHGVNVETTENGQLALDMVLCRDNTYELVFMDNLMPVMVTSSSFLLDLLDSL